MKWGGGNGISAGGAVWGMGWSWMRPLGCIQPSFPELHSPDLGRHGMLGLVPAKDQAQIQASPSGQLRLTPGLNVHLSCRELWRQQICMGYRLGQLACLSQHMLGLCCLLPHHAACHLAAGGPSTLRNQLGRAVQALQRKEVIS